MRMLKKGKCLIQQKGVRTPVDSRRTDLLIKVFGTVNKRSNCKFQ